MAQQDTEHKEAYCEHYGCRCIRAHELADMGMTWEAIQCHSRKVKCRKVEGAHFFNSLLEIEPREETK